LTDNVRAGPPWAPLPTIWGAIYILHWGHDYACLVNNTVYEVWGTQIQHSRWTNVGPIETHNFLNEYVFCSLVSGNRNNELFVASPGFEIVRLWWNRTAANPDNRRSHDAYPKDAVRVSGSMLNVDTTTNIASFNDIEQL
jgi:hypothetical protein